MTKPGTSWTVHQWTEHWLHNIASATTDDRGWDAYFYAVKHIVKHIGAHRLPNLLPDHLETMYHKMQQRGASAGTAHQVHRTIRTALNEAVRRGYLTRNPALIAKAPRVKEEEVEPFTQDEIAKIFDAALKSRNSCRWIIAVALGLRQAEVLGLRWEDIDLDAGTLRVTVQRPRPKWKHGCHGSCDRKQPGRCPNRFNVRNELEPPKSRAGRRPIGLPAPLVDHLTRHRSEQEEEREKAGDLWRDEGWVFTDETGAPLNHRTDQKHWKDLLVAAGVREARLHDARHTSTTVLLELGVPERTAMGIMGWSNPSITRRYQHVTATARQDVAERIGGVLWEARTRSRQTPNGDGEARSSDPERN